MSPRVTTPQPIPALSEKEVARFWSVIDKSAGPDGCWRSGTPLYAYASFRVGGPAGKYHYRHRISFQLEFGAPPPERPLVLHRCNNRGCCNPRHLYAGTHADNAADHQRALDAAEAAKRCAA